MSRIRTAALSGALVLSALAISAPAYGQGLPLLEWEQVGPDSARVVALGFDSWPGSHRLWITGSIYSVTTGNRYGLYTSDGQPSSPWTFMSREYGVDASQNIIFLGPDTLLTAFQTVRRSTDGGLTFDPIFLPTDGAGKHLTEAPPGSPYAGALFAASHVLSRSDDRGATWSWIGFPAMNDGFAADGRAGAYALRSGRVLLLGRGGCLRSDDGGATVEPCPTFYYPDVGVWLDASVYLPGGGENGADRVLATGYRAGRPYEPVWASDDGGETWAEVTRPPSTDVTFAAVALPGAGARSALFVKGMGEVWQTDDAGASWTLRGVSPAVGPPPGDPNGPNTRVTSATVGPDGRLYLGHGTQGPAQLGGVWRTAAPVGTVPGPTGSAGAVPSGVSVTAVPNPSGGRPSVAVTLGRPSASVRVSVFDALGREVAVLHDGPLGAGTHRLGLDGEALPAGSYVARVVGGASR